MPRRWTVGSVGWGPETVGCLTLRGSVTPTFFGMTGLSSTELVTSDWIETVEGYTWPGVVSSGTVIDETPDFVMQAIPVTGGYVYTRQSADLTTLDLVDPSGVVTSWVSGETEAYALALDASGDYVVVVAEDAGAVGEVNGLYRVTPAGSVTALDTGDATDGVSPGAIATTPDGAVWYSRFGAGQGLYRWHGGSSSAVAGVDVTTPVPRPDSSVWVFTVSGWRSVTSGLVVSADSPCDDLDPSWSVSAAWTDDWSIVAIQELGGDVYEVNP